MRNVKSVVATVGTSLITLIGASSQVLALGCPFGGTLGGLGRNESLAERLEFENKSVDVVGFVGNASLDLVGVEILDVDGGAVFGIDGEADCTARPPVNISRGGNSRFDDAVIRCGFGSIPDSLVYTIAIVNIDPDRIPDECRGGGEG